MDPCLRAPKGIRFGLFEADLVAGELRKHGRKVKLQEQPFQLLALLVQRPGQIVPREELQKALWPADTFVEFDQAVNTAIKKLRQALGDSAENPRFVETLPRRGYRFIAPIASLEGAVPIAVPGRPHLRWIVAFIAIVIIAAAGWLVGKRTPLRARSAMPVPLTTYPGEESQASFSPDGNQVAFVWNGEKQDNFDIYAKLIGSDSLLRLTTDPASDFRPAWSPDGRWIAFLREISPDRKGVFLIPAIGGGERKLAEINCCQAGSGLSWSPDGKWLATVDRADSAAGQHLVRLSPEDGQKVRLTSPSKSWPNDVDPAFSPDGRMLAFVRRRSPGSFLGQIFVLALSPNGDTEREPIQVTFRNQWIGSPAWSADGREVLFSAGKGNSWLWKLRFPLAGEPKQLFSLGDAAGEPAISQRLNRLVYTRFMYQANTWRVEMSAAGGKASPPVRLLSSTRTDYNAQYSPDGKRIAFHSTRSGLPAIWVSNSDGSNAKQLTFLDAPLTGSPRWSPNGERIVFDSNLTGQYQIYTISADGGKSQRLTFNPSDDGVASWSRDGKSIYFVSRRSGEWQVWKMPAQGGEAVQVTRHGGYVAFESPDGRFVYYSKGTGPTSLWRVPVGGGEERQVLDSILWLNFVVTSDGVFFVPGHADGIWTIRFLNFRTGTITIVARIEKSPELGLSLSPDGRQILYSQVDEDNSDLMLVENFR
jgi:Tol biopolymer transport system component/DNA-binding winged helix-turn-helix (wHTH) protein